MTTETKKTDPSRVTLGSAAHPVRFSYAWIFEPKIDEEKLDKKTGKPRELYSMQIIIPKSDPAAKALIDKAVRAAADTKIPGKAIPSVWKLPLRDGDEEWEEKGEAVKAYRAAWDAMPAEVEYRRFIEGKLTALGQAPVPAAAQAASAAASSAP